MEQKYKEVLNIGLTAEQVKAEREITTEELKEMTANLPDIRDMIVGRSDGFVVYESNGTATGTSWHNEPAVAVQGLHLSKDNKFGHTHDESEWLIVYRGKVKVMDGNGNPLSDVLNIGAGIGIEPRQEHIIEAIEDSWLVCITIPASEGYPTCENGEMRME